MYRTLRVFTLSVRYYDNILKDMYDILFDMLVKEVIYFSLVLVFNIYIY